MTKEHRQDIASKLAAFQDDDSDPNAGVKKLLDQHAERMGAIASGFEKRMQQQYEEIVQAATAKAEAMANAATNGVVTATPEVPQKPGKFQTLWIENDGQRWLALNEPAVEYFGLIFDQLGDAIPELIKEIQSKSGRNLRR